MTFCVLSDELQAYETAKATAESEGKSRFESHVHLYVDVFFFDFVNSKKSSRLKF